jgi:hypothetical protein
MAARSLSRNCGSWRFSAPNNIAKNDTEPLLQIPHELQMNECWRRRYRLSAVLQAWLQGHRVEAARLANVLRIVHF